jgi:hypothetical protein
MHSSFYPTLRARTTVAEAALARKHEVSSSSTHAQLLEYRRRCALAIAKPRGKALLISASNNGNGWISIDDAITREAAFAVDVANDILAVDGDRPEHATAVHQLVDALRNAGYRPVLAASGQPGRFHVFARIAHAEERKGFAIRAKNLGFDVRRSIRPPLAPHRLGLRPQLLDPSDPDAALEALQEKRGLLFPHTHRLRVQSDKAGSDPSRSQVLQRIHHAGSLSAHMQRLLEQGDGTGRYPSRSEVIQALALAAVNARWPFDRFFRALLIPQHAGGEKVQELVTERGIRHARLYAHRCWRRAEARAAASPVFRDRQGALAVITMIERDADECAWPGTAGGSNRAVLQAHLELARKLGSLTYGASDRLITERAGVTFPTANKSHKRLSAHGWLARVELGRGPRASTWRLCLPKGRIFNTLISSGGCVDEC